MFINLIYIKLNLQKIGVGRVRLVGSKRVCTPPASRLEAWAWLHGDPGSLLGRDPSYSKNDGPQVNSRVVSLGSKYISRFMLSRVCCTYIISKPKPSWPTVHKTESLLFYHL